jgi:DNA-directed RNA polymerase specialized sigma subunit
MPWVQRDGTRTHVDVLFMGVVDDTPIEVQEAVQEAMGIALSPLERAVVECAVDGDMSLSQTATALGLKAKSYVHRVKIRAFAKLRAHLTQHPVIRERYGIND